MTHLVEQHWAATLNRLGRSAASTLVVAALAGTTLAGCNSDGGSNTGSDSTTQQTQDEQSDNSTDTVGNSTNSGDVTQINTKDPAEEPKTEDPVNHIPVINNTLLNLTAVTGEYFDIAIDATDSDDDELTYNASNLPAGLSINSGTGLISGTVTAVAGNYTSEISVSDAVNPAVTVQLSWDIDANASQLIGWYKFDEQSGVTVHDSSGYGHNGTLIINGDKNFDRWTDGRLSGALTMDGGADVASGTINNSQDDNDWVEVPMITELKNSASAFSVSAWVYRTVHQNVAILANNYPYGIFFGFHEYAETDAEYASGPSRFKWGVVTDPTPTAEFGPPTDSAECWTALTADANGDTAPLNQWFHMAGTWDGQTAKLYVNGSRICSAKPKTTTGAAAITDYPISISGFKNSGNLNSVKDEISGKIDDLRIYSRVLSEQQVAELYNAAQ